MTVLYVKGIILSKYAPSTAEHEKFCGNLGGPSPKAKYYLTTDSEPVPWGKGEKYPCEGSEIVPETVCLQAVGAVFELRPRAFCIMSQRVTLRSKVKPEGVAVAKASLNRAFSCVE